MNSKDGSNDLSMYRSDLSTMIKLEIVFLDAVYKSYVIPILESFTYQDLLQAINTVSTNGKPVCIIHVSENIRYHRYCNNMVVGCYPRQHTVVKNCSV